EDLISLSKLPESLKRPSCLEHLYDCENGKWDPERWYTANFESAPESSSLTFTNGKDGRKVTDRDYKKRFSPNHPIERLKSERDGIVLSPQRRSFVTGCHVKTLPHAYTRHLSLPDREESKGDWDQKGEKERDSRERPLRKADSGRIQFEKERSLHDSVDNHSYSRDDEFARSRDQERERKRDRDLRNQSARERRGEGIDSCHNVDDKSYNARDWRDREVGDRGFNRNSRRRNNRQEKEPEWYTGGPTSQTDVIELRGFEHQEDHGHQMVDGRKPNHRKDNRANAVFSAQSTDPARKGASEASSPISNKVSPNHLGEPRPLQKEQKDKKNIPNHKQQENQSPMMPQHNVRAATNNKLFDFEEVLSAILPSDENGVRHGSRFSRFFPEPNGSLMESDASSLDDVLLSDGSRCNSIVPSPVPNMGPMGAMQHSYHRLPHFHGQSEQQTGPQTFPKPHLSVPDSAGDNNGHPPMLPSLTALFNSAARGGPNSYRWNGHLDGSLETPDTSLFTNSAASSNSFSAQDAETQLKAMLFGGSRGSSGCVSPARLPIGVHQRAKTLAELEADMHQDSPPSSGLKPGGPSSTSDSGDITAFSKLLIMMNAASEANQNMAQREWSSHAVSGMVPSHNEFNLAVRRNKEKQMQLLQQSLHHSQHPGMPSLPQQAFHPQMGHNGQSLPPQMGHSGQSVPTQNHQPAQAMNIQQYHPQHLDGLTAPRPFADLIDQQSCSVGMPQAMSTPQTGYKRRAPAGGLSADPLLSLIQQHPQIIMNSVSPAPLGGPIQAPQQSLGSGPAHGSSPLMFGRMSPAMLGTLSPVQPCRSSPAAPHTFGASLSRSAVSSPTEMRVPVVSRALSPQEWSAHNQAVAQSAFINRQLQEQSSHFLPQGQNRALSQSQHHIVVVRPVPSAQPVLPPTPQPKGASLDAFTPTSVLRKMHSDKVSEKRKSPAEIKEDTGLMEGIAERNLADQHGVPRDELAQKSEPKLTGDLNGVSFLDAVNSNLTTVNGHQDKQVVCGQRNVLPGALSQPMSVEEKLKLSALAEKPGYLSQLIDQSGKVAAEAGRGSSRGRPGIDAEELPQENQTQQMNAPSPLTQEHTSGDSQSCRAVTGAAPEAQGVSDSSPAPPDVQLNTGHRLVTGRAITGRSCVQHHLEAASGPVAQNLGLLHVMEQHSHYQQMQAQCHGVVLHPEAARTLVPCLDPAVALPVSYHLPMCGQPADVGCGVMQHHCVGANAMNCQQNQHFSHMMAMQYPQQHCLPQPQPHVMAPSVSAQLNPYSQTSGPLSTAALRVAIQRLASPAGAGNINGALQPTSAVHTPGGDGGHRVDLTSGIQRWFSSDILRTHLPSLPTLPSHGIQVMTVDELERG
ncbi:unnamed protein product, partial [Candidula unifasciata]